MYRKYLLGLAMIGVTVVGVRADAEPAGSAFTFQGQLMLEGRPVDGLADFRFALHERANEEGQVGPTVVLASVTVDGGIFSVDLDFGIGAIGTQARWLEIDVRSPAWTGQGPEPTFVTLIPRQPIRAVPLALATVQNYGDGTSLDAAAGGPNDVVAVDVEGSVNVGLPSMDSGVVVTKPIVGNGLSVRDAHVYCRGRDNGYGLVLGLRDYPSAAYLQTTLNDEFAPGGNSIPLLLNPAGGDVCVGDTPSAATLNVGGDISVNGMVIIDTNGQWVGEDVCEACNDGSDGEDGEDGDDGISCWDLNENGTADVAEDTNGDGTVDVLDCRASGGGVPVLHCVDDFHVTCGTACHGYNGPSTIPQQLVNDYCEGVCQNGVLSASTGARSCEVAISADVRCEANAYDSPEFSECGNTCAEPYHPWGRLWPACCVCAP